MFENLAFKKWLTIISAISMVGFIGEALEVSLINGVMMIMAAAVGVNAFMEYLPKAVAEELSKENDKTD